MTENQAAPGETSKYFPDIQDVPADSPLKWLRQGWQDLKACPLASLFYGACDGRSIPFAGSCVPKPSAQSQIARIETDRHQESPAASPSLGSRSASSPTGAILRALL